MKAGDGAAAIEFIQGHCRVDKDTLGGKRGDLIRLRPWQQLQLYRVLARRADGRLKHRVGLLGVARKNTKSTAFGSGLGLYMADQGPAGGEVYVCAGAKEQARIVFRSAKFMVESDPYLASRTKVYRDHIEWVDTGTVFRVLSSDADLQEGLNPTTVIFDEVHVQPDDELWDVMSLATGAREEPLMLGITTAGDPVDRTGRDSLCYRLYQYGRRVATLEVPDRTFYFAWWEPDDPEPGADGTPGTIDHRDPLVWAQSNPGLGDLVSVDDLESASLRTPEAEFKTKRCNMWVQGKLTAVAAGAWASRGVDRATGHGSIVTGSNIEVPVDWLVGSVLMLDGSWSGDSTGVVGCTTDSHLFVVTHHERTEMDDEHWRVPVTSVMADVRAALDAGARGIVFDPYRWQHPMAELAEDGYLVAEFPTNSVARMVPAWKDFYDAIQDAELTHDNNLAMARHIGNIVLKIDAHGARPVKVSKGSTRHIDLGICAVGAHASRNIDFDDEPGRAGMWSY